MKYINLMPKKIRQLIQNKTALTLTLLLVTVGVFFITNQTSASVFSTIWEGFSDPLKFVSDLLTSIFLLVIKFLGILFVFFVGIMIELAKFNTFIGMPMVATGWGLARDIANMFFIVVLLIIAFSTVLKISSYHYQKTLTKLLIMAILVNFSKLIAGFLIDFFQVIMLTFVNGFKDVAGGNLAQGFGIYEMLSQGVGSPDASGFQEGLVVAAALAVVMILVADMVILVMIAVLMWRIAMLWVLVIISPLAYLSYAFMPKYWSQWWQMFFQHLISGPVIAFFLWLALLTMQQGEIDTYFKLNETKEGTGELQSQMDDIIPSAVNQSVLLNYMVVMALLLGGLTISQKVAAQSGGAVGNFAQRVQKVGTRAALMGTGGYFVKRGMDKVQKFNQMRGNIRADKDTQQAAALMGLYGGLKKNTIGLAGRGIRKAYTKVEGTQKRDQNRIALDTSRNDLMTMKGSGWDSAGHPQNNQYKNKEQEVIKLEKQRKKLQIQKWVARGGVGAIGVVSIPFGGSLAGALAVGSAVPALVGAGSKKMSQSGQAEIEMTKNWRAREVSKYGDEIKKLTDDKIEVIIKDEAESSSHRLAALFEKISRGGGRADEGNYYRDLVKRLGGNDKVINNQYDNLARQYLPGYIPIAEKTESYRADDTKRSADLADFVDRAKKRQFNFDVMDVDSWRRSMGGILKGLVDVKKDESGNITGEVFDHTDITTAIKKASPAKKQIILDSLESIAKTDVDEKQRLRATEVLMSNGGVDRVDWTDSNITNEKFAQMYQKNKRDIEGSLVNNPDAVSLGFVEKMINSLNNRDVAAFYSNMKKTGRSDNKTVETYLSEQTVNLVNKVDQADEEQAVNLMSNVIKRSGDVKQIFNVNAKVQNKVLEKYASQIKPDDFSRIKAANLDEAQLNKLTQALLQKIDYATVESGINKGIQEDKTEDMRIIAEKIIDIATTNVAGFDSAAKDKAEKITKKAESNKENSRLAQYM